MRTRNANKEELVKKEAIALLVREGFEGFSMNKLAKACGISVATLYIYYQDKDDLIKKIGVELGTNFFEGALKDFDPKMNFAEGLRKQWDNRIDFTLKNIEATKCWEAIRHSPHNEYVLENSLGNFKAMQSLFCKNAIENGQLTKLPFEVYWSLAYAPLYNLLRFEAEGKSMGGIPFKLTLELVDITFKAVIKALTP